MLKRRKTRSLKPSCHYQIRKLPSYLNRKMILRRRSLCVLCVRVSFSSDRTCAYWFHGCNSLILGTGQNASTNADQPLLLSSSSKTITRKRKSTENYAISLTKEKVTSHWREARSNAFSTTASQPPTPSAHSQNETLSQAIRSGLLRIVDKTKENSDDNTTTADTSNSDLGLVAYGDSD